MFRRGLELRLGGLATEFMLFSLATFGSNSYGPILIVAIRPLLTETAKESIRSRRLEGCKSLSSVGSTLNWQWWRGKRYLQVGASVGEAGKVNSRKNNSPHIL